MTVRRRYVQTPQIRGLLLVLAAAVVVGSPAAWSQSPPPFPAIFNSQAETVRLSTPAEALAAFAVPAGFQVTMFAAEPDVQQPIALATDERGRLWVAENFTYAESALNYDTKLRDRIVILEDVDHDGRFDRRRVFWDQAVKLTSIEIGHGGIWALCAPHLLFIPDHNRDDVPDSPPEVVLDGWDSDRIRHNIVNGLRWGPDGWLYGRHGIQATSLVGTPGTAPEHRERIDCGIWRYSPTTRQFEVVARGTTNSWGMDWDDHGEMFFINTVIGHLWHVLPGAYYQRMYGEHLDPHVYELLPQTADHYHWDASEPWSQIRQSGVTATTDAAGGGHAHCGMLIYLGDNWPAEYHGSVLTVNLHGLRINRDRLERQGATYVGRHAPDFARSRDPWFRGVELLTGPDGGVYVADWSDIEECHENDGVHRTSGRIFKIVHGRPAAAAMIDLATLSDRELVELQLHRNDWFVRHARRLLHERHLAGKLDQAAVQRLRALHADHPDVTRRLRAFWCLSILNAVEETALLQQLTDPDEHLRCWAIRALLDSGPLSPAVRGEFQRLAREDRSGLVLTYLASSLRWHATADRWRLAGALAARTEFANDPIFPLMVWYGVEPGVVEFPAEAVTVLKQSALAKVRRYIARRLTGEIERQPEAVNQLVAALSAADQPAARADIVAGIGDALRGWRRAPAPTAWSATAEQLLAGADDDLRQQLRELSFVFGDGRALDELRELAASDKADLDVRRAALRALVDGRVDGIVPLLQKLLKHRDLAGDAAHGLAAFQHPDTPRLLIESFAAFRQPVQQAAIDVLVSRAVYAHELAAAVEQGKIGRHAVSPFQLRQMSALGAELAAEVSRLWPELREVSAERRGKIQELREQLSPETLRQADLNSGRALFQRMCHNCHTLYGDGGKIGPDLTGGQRSNLNYLLENIVDPNATVSQNYQMTVFVLADGRVVQGILGEQTDRTIAVQTATERLLLLRDEIEEMQALDVSLMPDRQLDVLTPDQIRDLLGYLMRHEP